MLASKSFITDRRSMRVAALCFLFTAIGMPDITDAQSGRQDGNPAKNRAAAQQDFLAGNDLMKQHRYSEALARYRESLAKLPDDPALLGNAALAAYFAKDYSLAADLWNRGKQLEPQNWQIRAKLIQTYQALGNLAARDAERSALFDLRTRGETESLSKAKRYCREQIEVTGRRVIVFEYFKLEGKRAVRYAFIVLRPDEDAEDFRFSLGSYEDTTAIARELGELKQGERAFHLDYYNKNFHATYAHYNSEPSYEDVRKTVLQSLEKQGKGLSENKLSTGEAVR